MRTTSKMAYKDLVGSGSKDRQIDYIKRLLICAGKPLSSREIAKAINIETSSASGRINYMKQIGIVEEVEKKKCETTGRLVSFIQLVRGN